MKAIKLLWLSDRLHLITFGRTISGDNYVAMKLGPVPSATRDILEDSPFLEEAESDYGKKYLKIEDKYNFSSINELDADVFSETDIDTLERVYEDYGKYTAYQLSDISHKFPEWKKWESALNGNKQTRFPIDFNDFFTPVDENQVLFEAKDDLELVKAYYLKKDALTNS